MTGPSRNKHSTTQGFVQCYSFTFFLEFQRLWKWNTERGEIMGWCEIKPAGKPVYLRVRRRNKTYSNCGCACLSSLRAPSSLRKSFPYLLFLPTRFFLFPKPFLSPSPSCRHWEQTTVVSTGWGTWNQQIQCFSNYVYTKGSDYWTKPVCNLY